MKEIERDDEREKRIEDEAIVDAYGPVTCRGKCDQVK